MTGGDRFERAMRRIYRALLHVYPAHFRDDFGRDAEDTMIDRLRAARRRGMSPTIGFAGRAIADVVFSGVAERGSQLFHGFTMLAWTDVKYAFRLMRRTPIFTLLTIVVLGGGLGVSIFTFSFVYSAMLKPLPIPGGERIVRIEGVSRGNTIALDAADVRAMRSAVTTLSALGTFTDRTFVVGDERHARVLSATAAEPNVFEVARGRPELGRSLSDADAAHGAEPVIVLSDWAWHVVFGADSAVVGRRIELNGTLTRVIGVMPKGYGFPVAAEAWVPLGQDLLASAPGIERVGVYARLAPGVTVDRATVELEQLLARVHAARVAELGVGAVSEVTGVNVRSFPMAQLDGDGPLAFTVLNGLATLILLLACINVVNLLLARANDRARETAVRLALGASRGRLTMQSMLESVVLCIAGGLLATAIAAWGLDLVDTWMRVHLERNLPFWWTWHIDRPAILAAGVFVTAVIAALGGVVSGRVAGVHFNDVLRDGGARSGDRRAGRAGRGLVVAQVATVSVLMYFGVLSSVVAYRVAHADVGYDTRNLLSTGVSLPADRYATDASRARFYEQILNELNRRGPVTTSLLRARLASITDADGAFDTSATRSPIPPAAPHAYVTGVFGAVELTGARLRGGRAFDAGDDERGAAVAIVSRTFADTAWPRRSAIGQHLRLAIAADSSRVRTVVGVVDDVLMGAPFSRSRSEMAIYVPLRQTVTDGTEVLFRHRGDAGAAQAALYAALAAVDARLVPPDVSTYDEILDKSASIAKFVTSVFALCFGFALLLAVSGTYALMARAIAQRTREIGIRRALGATDESVARLLLGQGARQLGVGVAIALPVMLAIGYGFWNFFPVAIGVSASSAIVVSATIVGVVLAATYVPTRQALRVSPRDALGSE